MAALPPHAGEEAPGTPGTEAGGRFTRPLHRCDTVGKLIVYYRELKGWSQKQLWRALRMSQSRLSSLERDDREPKWGEMDRIAFFLEQPLDVFSLLRRRPAAPAPWQSGAGVDPAVRSLPSAQGQGAAPP